MDIYIINSRFSAFWKGTRGCDWSWTCNCLSLVIYMYYKQNSLSFGCKDMFLNKSFTKETDVFLYLQTIRLPLTMQIP